MSNYDPHDWTSHLFDIEGSLVRDIFGRVLACVVWAAVVTLLHLYGPDFFHDLAIPETAHSLIGASLGLLLVFRTNSSYDRFWEGRKLWGGIVNQSRNLARQASAWLSKDRALADRTILWTVLFAHSVMSRLRETHDIGPLQNQLTEAERDEVQRANHTPLAIARKMTDLVHSARENNLIDSHQLQAIDQNIQLLVDECGACERIRSTPLPFAYAVHLRRALMIYCFTLPFALVSKFGLVTIPVTLILAYTLFGIEEIGVEIEDPFGEDTNDLPLDRIYNTIEQNLMELMSHELPRDVSSSRSV